jgi:hypothetical protein
MKLIKTSHIVNHKPSSSRMSVEYALDRHQKTHLSCKMLAGNIVSLAGVRDAIAGIKAVQSSDIPDDVA